MLYKRRERNREEEKKKSQKLYIKKNYRYRIDNKYQKAKIKNLEQRLDSQKYNMKKTKQSHKNYKIYI